MNSKIGASVLLLFSITLLSAYLAGPEAAGQTLGRGEVAFRMEYSTFLGGSLFDAARDVAVDGEGNIYVTGGTMSRDFPTTEGAYDRTFEADGKSTSKFGTREGFVTKFDPVGKMLWSTLIGAGNYELIYGIEVDRKGFVYVAGEAGEDLAVTENAIQPQFKGGWFGGYGMQNAFVAKLKPDGSDVVWVTYMGNGVLARDMDIDAGGNVYLAVAHRPDGPALPEKWFANAYQKKADAGGSLMVAKIKSDGSDVEWATYLGGSVANGGATSLRVDRQGYVHIAFGATSPGMPVTANAYDKQFGGQAEYHLTRLHPDGSGIDYGTWVGGSGDEWLSTHNLAVDDAGNAHVGFWTSSSDIQTTAGALQRQACPEKRCQAIVKVAPDGELLAATYIGGTGTQNLDGIHVDGKGNVYISGETMASDNPVTANAYQRRVKGDLEAFFSVLSPDLTRLLYSTYLGGSGMDKARASAIDGQGSIYLVGATNSRDWPLRNPAQGRLSGADDIPVAKFGLISGKTVRAAAP